jgi:hypothetical protein
LVFDDDAVDDVVVKVGEGTEMVALPAPANPMCVMMG